MADRPTNRVFKDREFCVAKKARAVILFFRTSGIARATAKIGLANLAYNMRRLMWLDSKPAPA